MLIPDDRNTAPKLLVVIDDNEVRVYRIRVHGAVPVRIVPYDPHGYGKDPHSPLEWADAKPFSERMSFHEAIAKTLQGAEQVLLLESSSGRNSAMESLLADLKDHHPDVAQKIVGSVTVDAIHTTEGQLLAKAKQFYSELNENNPVLLKAGSEERHDLGFDGPVQRPCKNQVARGTSCPSKLIL